MRRKLKQYVDGTDHRQASQSFRLEEERAAKKKQTEKQAAAAAANKKAKGKATKKDGSATPSLDAGKDVADVVDTSSSTVAETLSRAA